MANTTQSLANNPNFVDPLMEQVRSRLNLGPRANDPSQRRLRRFSDADRPGDGASLTFTKPKQTAIPGADSSRQLPKPEEISLRMSSDNQDSAIEDSEECSEQELKQHHCSEDICAVTKVFETTELLEIVLGFLETKDVLALRLTNNHWNSTVNRSPKLRLHLFTFGQWGLPASQFQLLPLLHPGLTIELGEELYLGRWISITFTSEAAHHIRPEPTRRVRSRSIFEGLRGGLGSRRDSWPASKETPTTQSTLQNDELFVTQPPIPAMQAFIVYSDTSNNDTKEDEAVDEAIENGPRACAKLNCDAGITLGFLAETAQSLLMVERRGAGPSRERDAKVMFKGIVSFCPPDDAPKKRSKGRTVTRLP